MTVTKLLNMAIERMRVSPLKMVDLSLAMLLYLRVPRTFRWTRYWWCQKEVCELEHGPVEIVDFPMKYGGFSIVTVWWITRGYLSFKIAFEYLGHFTFSWSCPTVISLAVSPTAGADHSSRQVRLSLAARFLAGGLGDVTNCGLGV